MSGGENIKITGGVKGGETEGNNRRRRVSESHVSVIPANLVALERRPSGPLDGGDARAASYGNADTHALQMQPFNRTKE